MPPINIVMYIPNTSNIACLSGSLSQLLADIALVPTDDSVINIALCIPNKNIGIILQRIKLVIVTHFLVKELK